MERWGGSGMRWGRGNYIQNLLYKVSILKRREENKIHKSRQGGIHRLNMLG